ncbi:MAG: hypothetical protein ASARMPRED_004544 [Alectoria sarmentosa]|nr:MAG: hypothetical protein ASARMPRED_004544 [Alectoria sarmentosa]
MDPLPDQFLFVNKSARSRSLSHSNPEERFFIHSHVHGKFHKNKGQTRQRSLLPGSRSKSNCPNSQSTFETSRTTNCSERSDGSTAAKPVSRQRHPKGAIPDIQENPYSGLGSSTPHNIIDAIAIDPFYCTSTHLDAKDQRLLHYPFTSFIEATFNAESLSGTTPSTTFRHREAIIERLRHCVVDRLTMYSTLAYCASCMRWALREEERERPPELYVLKAIEALKSRLERAEVVDTWLILSIYALAVSEMWAENYEAATAHLKMTRHLVTQLGGLTKLDPYLMESILLCDKYVAIGKFEAPIFPLDWDPGSLPAQKMLKIQVEVEPLLSELTQGFFDLDKHILGTEMLQLIDNIRVCAQVSQQMGTQEMTDPSDQHWLFLRHQAIFCRLLSLPTSSKTQECCRVALIMWLLKITVYFGAQRWSKRLLPALKTAILQLDKAGEWCPSALIFWMTSLGAMTAEYTDERDWFLKRTTKAGRSLGTEPDKEPFRRVLKKFLFLKSEDGLQFFRMVRAARQLSDEA